jgi:hypothetical protein
MIIDPMAGKPDNFIPAQHYGTLFTLGWRDFMVDEIFLNFLGAFQAQGRKPIPRSKIAHNQGKLQTIPVQKSPVFSGGFKIGHIIDFNFYKLYSCLDLF